MKSIQNYLFSRKYIILFSVIYFILRLVMLNSYFVLRDERDLILTTLSLAQTGKDLYGNAFPLIFSRISPQTPLLGMYWAVPIFSYFHITSPLIAKVILISPTLFFPLLVFELIHAVTKEKKIGLLASFIISFSPWFFHISRLVMDSQLAYFFCLLGLIYYVKEKKLLGVFFLILSYFSYFGIRPFILISVPYIELWNYIQYGNRNKKRIIISLFLFIVTFASLFLFGTNIEHTSARSSSEIILLNKEKLTLTTNFLREISSTPFVLRKFIDNKISVVTDALFYNFFKGIDLSYLFFTGDYSPSYSNHVTGQYFPFLFPFFIFGICYLAKKRSLKYYFIAGLSFVGLVSSIINTYSLTFSIRSSFSLVGIGFVCALGIVYTTEMAQKWKSILVLTTVFVYSLFSIVFVYKYFFQSYKVINSFFNEQERQAAQIVKENNVKIFIVSNIHSYFLSYIATQKNPTYDLFKTTQYELNKPNNYEIEGHRFNQCKTLVSLSPGEMLPPSTLIEDSCLAESTRLYLINSKSATISAILNTEYHKYDINRQVKFVLFK